MYPSMLQNVFGAAGEASECFMYHSMLQNVFGGAGEASEYFMHHSMLPKRNPVCAAPVAGTNDPEEQESEPRSSQGPFVARCWW